MEAALQALRADVATCQSLEQQLRGRQPAEARARARAKTGCQPRTVSAVLDTVLGDCTASRKRAREEAGPGDDLSDDGLSQHTRFTSQLALAPFSRFLWYVPRLVNVVTLAEALPVAGSGLKLPLDLQMIASRCSSSFYAPRRFAAVQLAYSNPRCRVLIFRQPLLTHELTAALTPAVSCGAACGADCNFCHGRHWTTGWNRDVGRHGGSTRDLPRAATIGRRGGRAPARAEHEHHQPSRHAESNLADCNSPLTAALTPPSRRAHT